MPAIGLFAVLLLSAAFSVDSARAQTPVPEVMPFDIPYGTPITLERCKKVVEAAIADAKRRNWKMAVAVVGPGGDLICFEKMEGTQLSASTVAPAKAQSSVLYRRPTKALYDAMEAGHHYLATLPGVVGSPGGEPLVEGGKMIGAVGVAGGAGPQDGVVAKAAAETVK